MRLYYLKSDSKVAATISMLGISELDCDLIPISDHDLATVSELRQLSPLGLTPILQTDGMALFTMTSILKYIAKLRKEKGYSGLLLKEETQIDQWLDICYTDLEPLAGVAHNQLSSGAYDPQTSNDSLREIAKILGVLENRFKQDHRYIVGYGPSIADVAVASTLTHPFWTIFQNFFSQQFPFVNQWLRECQERFNFSAVRNSIMPDSRKTSVEFRHIPK